MFKWAKQPIASTDSIKPTFHYCCLKSTSLLVQWRQFCMAFFLTVYFIDSCENFRIRIIETA